MNGHISRNLAIGLLVLLIAGCDGGRPSEADNPQTAGLLATTRVFGFTYENELVEVDGHIGTWENRWQERVVSVSKLYRGIFPISVQENETAFFNEFDPDILESLFPLGVGRSVSFSGVHRLEPQDEAYPFWAHLIVRGDEEVRIKEGNYPTFVIDLTVDYEFAEGTKRLQRTLWYSPELSMTLKSASQFDGEEWVQYVLSVEPPANGSGRQRRRTGSPLGTTTI